MFKHFLKPAVFFAIVFLVGLVAVCWVALGYLGSHPLGAAVAAVIGVCYVAGAFELYRYRQATSALAHAVADLSEAPSSLGEWLDRLPAGLRNPVRLRIEGERVALPAPALTPYLVGLLVLLGMLGTLLGMMLTLRGTGLALESATDLQAVRGSLAAPVAGLGVAFGTSIAGVATSAMLGLLSALCRRERMQVVQALDAKIATSLRVHSQSWQREEAFKLLQRQSEAMPALVDRLQEMTTALQRQSEAAGERQLAGQEAFQASIEAVCTRLAASLEQSLNTGVAEGARAVGASLQPLVETTLAGLARETASLHGSVDQAVSRQLQALSAGFEANAAQVGNVWETALDAQRQSNETLARNLDGTLERFAATFEERSAGLLDSVSARLDASATHAASTWNDTLSRQETVNGDLAERNRQALAAATATFEEQAAALVRSVQQSHTELQAALESRDRERLGAWAENFATMTTALNGQWERTAESVANRQQEICDTLARTADQITAQAQAQAGATIAEISQLVQAASEAPKAAAEVVAELRQKLSDSMVRDTAMLEERSRLLATLETLLDAVNHASTEQRAAVDALVGTSADLLERVGTRFTDHIEAQTGKLDGVAAQLSGSAVEVASLGDAFGASVQAFGESNEALMQRLQQVAEALDKSLARSDEQLAYYVAQAREVVDLSVLSQQQIIENLQRLADAPAAGGAEAA